LAYQATIGALVYQFADLKTLLAKATPLRSGDELAGVAAANAEERVAAQMALADVPLKRFLEEPLTVYENDEVTRLIFDSHNERAFSEIAMRLQDLVKVASKIRVVTRFRTTVGLPGRLATRLQPNHPADDAQGIAASIVDGLMLGSGDAVIGINPASDNPQMVKKLLEMIDAIRRRYSIPTQSCVLAHVTTQMEALRAGAPLDLMFQSIGGTEGTNTSFGINLALLREAHEMARELKRGTVGDNIMYFETGQGSALSASAHEGMDQQTCEARAYGVARAFRPMLVNTVVGFIGPEYLYDGKQILRAALEDHFCGKLLGLPMGCDVCYTNHAEADDDDMDAILTVLAAAGVNYIMGVPGADDIMLNYQSSSFHDALYLRSVFGLKPTPEFEEWLTHRPALPEMAALLHA